MLWSDQGWSTKLVEPASTGMLFALLIIINAWSAYRCSKAKALTHPMPYTELYVEKSEGNTG